MANAHIPEGIQAALAAEGILPEEVKSTRPEEVLSLFVELPGGFGFAITYQKMTIKDGETKWFKIFDGRQHGE